MKLAIEERPVRAFEKLRIEICNTAETSNTIDIDKNNLKASLIPKLSEMILSLRFRDGLENVCAIVTEKCKNNRNPMINNILPMFSKKIELKSFSKNFVGGNDPEIFSDPFIQFIGLGMKLSLPILNDSRNISKF